MNMRNALPCAVRLIWRCGHAIIACMGRLSDEEDLTIEERRAKWFADDDGEPATDAERHAVEQLNVSGGHFYSDYHLDDEITLSGFRLLSAMPADVRMFIEQVMKMDDGNELDRRNRSLYGRDSIMAHLRYYIMSYRGTLNMMKAGYVSEDRTVDECIRYILEWHWNSHGYGDDLKTEKDFTMDDFRFILRMMNEFHGMTGHLLHDGIGGISGIVAYNVLIGLHRKGWDDDRIQHEINACLDNRKDGGNGVPFIVGMNVRGTMLTQYAGNADDYIAITDHIPSPDAVMPETRGEWPLEACQHDVGMLCKLVSCRKDTDVSCVPDSICDYMAFILRESMASANAVDEAERLERRSWMREKSFDTMYAGGFIHDAWVRLIRKTARELPVEALVLALRTMKAFIGMPGNSDYGWYVNYIDKAEVERRERSMMMNMAEAGVFRTARDYPVEFLKETVWSFADYNGLSYYDEDTEEIKTITDDEIPARP